MRIAREATILQKILKSVFKTVIDLLEHSDRLSGKLCDRFGNGIYRTGHRMRDVRDRASALYSREDHTVRNVISFAAGVGVGVGMAMLCAPASGEAIRKSIGEKAKDAKKRVQDRLSRRASTEQKGSRVAARLDSKRTTGGQDIASTSKTTFADRDEQRAGA